MSDPLLSQFQKIAKNGGTYQGTKSSTAPIFTMTPGTEVWRNSLGGISAKGPNGATYHIPYANHESDVRICPK